MAVEAVRRELVTVLSTCFLAAFALSGIWAEADAMNFPR
jgi:hypothetical protein